MYKTKFGANDTGVSPPVATADTMSGAMLDTVVDIMVDIMADAKFVTMVDIVVD